MPDATTATVTVTTPVEPAKTRYPNAWRLFCQHPAFAGGVGRFINPQTPGSVKKFRKAVAPEDWKTVDGTANAENARSGPECFEWWVKGEESGVPQPVGLYPDLIGAAAADFDYPPERGSGAGKPPHGYDDAVRAVTGKLNGIPRAFAATRSATPGRGHAWWRSESGGYLECVAGTAGTPEVKGKPKRDNYLIEHDLEEFARQWLTRAETTDPVDIVDLLIAFGGKPPAQPRMRVPEMVSVPGDNALVISFVDDLADKREARGAEATLHDEVMAHLVSMWKRGFSEDDLLAYAARAVSLGCDEGETTRQVAWVLANVKRRLDPLPAATPQSFGMFRWDGVCHEVSEDRSGVQLETILDNLDIRLEEDTRSRQLLYARDDQSIRMDTKSLNALRTMIEVSHYTLVRTAKTERRVPVAWKNDAWRVALDGYLSRDGRSHDFFEAWLRSRPAWDGEKRLSKFASAVFYCDPEDKVGQWAGPWVFCKAVQRTFHPGHQADDMLILDGAQGGGKSTTFGLVFPNGTEQRERWVRTNFSVLSSIGDPRRAAYALAGAVFVMCNEMKGISDAKLGDVKDFFTRPRDEADMKWEDRVSVNPRRCVFIGSTNGGEFLKHDRTGQRRFRILPIKADRNRKSDWAWVRKNRDQLWAEAVHYYDNMELEELDKFLEMDEGTHTLAEARAEEASLTDPAEEEFASMVSDPSAEVWQGKTTTEWCRLLGILPNDDVGRGPNKTESIRCGDVLRKHGFINKQVTRNAKGTDGGSVRPRVWVHDKENA